MPLIFWYDMIENIEKRYKYKEKAVESMLPQDFAERMKDMLKEDYDVFLKSYENEKYQALRVNPLKVKDAAVEEKAPFSLTKVPWAAHGFYYDSAVFYGQTE